MFYTLSLKNWGSHLQARSCAAAFLKLLPGEHLSPAWWAKASSLLEGSAWTFLAKERKCLPSPHPKFMPCSAPGSVQPLPVGSQWLPGPAGSGPVQEALWVMFHLCWRQCCFTDSVRCPWFSGGDSVFLHPSVAGPAAVGPGNALLFSNCFDAFSFGSPENPLTSMLCVHVFCVYLV